MLIRTEQPGKVKLMTTDRDLEDMMLKYYPDILLKGEIEKSHDGGTKIYTFDKLNESTIVKFLSEFYGCKPEEVPIGSYSNS